MEKKIEKKIEKQIEKQINYIKCNYFFCVFTLFYALFLFHDLVRIWKSPLSREWFCDII